MRSSSTSRSASRNASQPRRERKARRTAAGKRRHQTQASTTASASPFPAEEVAHEHGGQLVGAAPLEGARTFAPRQVLRPHLDAPDLSRVLGQLEQRRAPCGRDDRQDLPVELGDAVDEQVAPRADAARRVRVGALRREQHARARAA
jgi:hypothetical protein